MFPISIELGFRTLPFYEGLYFLVSFVVAGVWTARRWKRAAARGEYLPEPALERILLLILIGALLGARLSHFLFWSPGILLADPLEFFRFWDGGASVSGGIAFGILGAWLAARGSGVDFRAVAAVCAPPTLLGQAVGRVGCFLNGDAFGSPSSLAWAVSFPRYAHLVPGGGADRRWSSFAWEWCAERGLVGPTSLSSLPMHPTQVYEALLDLALLAAILAFQRRRPGAAGGKASLLLLAGGYSLIRFGMEFLRADHEGSLVLGLTAFQLALLALVLLCLLLGFSGKRAPSSAGGHGGKKRR